MATWAGSLLWTPPAPGWRSWHQVGPVILLHGGPGVPDYLAEVAEILAPRHRVIRYDQRGTPAVASESRHIP